MAAVLKARDIPFVFSTDYDVTNVLLGFLVGSQIISTPFKDGEVELQLRFAIEKALGARRVEEAPLEWSAAEAGSEATGV